MSEQPKCPVDHSTREAWIKNGGVNPHETTQKAPHPIPTDGDNADKCPVDHTARTKWAQMSNAKVLDGSKINTDYEHSSDNLPEKPIYQTDVRLPEDREISSIPRTGGDGNWIYPSQKQFFEAMKRKNWEPSPEDMNTVVPIHNAVNERAWHEILKWEDKKGSEKCGGLKLTSFKGDSKKITPKAYFWWALGYQKPFDRHDWTVDRCGQEVDYVIDFYAGKPNPRMPGMASFYLDVRPKLNSFEGLKLRIQRFFGGFR